MEFLNLKRRLDQALKEDAASTDVTTLAIPGIKSIRRKAILLAKESGVFCGGFLVPHIFQSRDKKARARFLKKDGASVRKGEKVLAIECGAATLLSGERLFLNLVCHLSGIASQTYRYVQAVRGTSAKILETRKTTPLWRDLEKYAVRCGGGENHRFSLGDAILVKDNHLQLLRERGLSVKDVYSRRKEQFLKRKNLKFLEVEATTIPEVWDAIKARPDIILLDNMPLNRLKAAIVLIKAAREALNSPKPAIEVSGGITLATARTYATLGVDRISVGALTHSAKALDFSLEVI